MKKLIAVIVVTAVVLAATACVLLPSSALLQGDVDGDGNVFAGDAREILRYSAKLSVSGKFDPAAADLNGDKMILADDARIALRMSARLEPTQIYEDRIESDSETTSEPVPEPESKFEPETSTNTQGIVGFGAELFRNAYKKGDNTLVSPLSVYAALGMLTAGADGNTLSQLESALGKKYGDLKVYMRDYFKSLEGIDALKAADSIWLRNTGVRIEPDFIAENREYFFSDVRTEPFDNGTVGDINGWVKEKTDGMIPSIIDRLTPDIMAVLINALAFDNEWAVKYDDTVKNQPFTGCDGAVQNAEFLRDREYMFVGFDSGDIKAAGFKKNYADSRFSFIAAMPEDPNADFAAFVAGLDAGAISAAVGEPVREELDVSFPVFEFDYTNSLVDELIAMGVTDVFSAGSADLTRMGTSDYGNLFVDEVLHKTYISVTKDGTRAAAVTAIIAKAASMPPEPVRKLVFDRPFIYMIWDNEANIPLFIGAVEKL
ncbi:MAG: hypothetical protein K6G90_02815 [Clostridia bacterium]|nr:hypothetical protein [Clostridia bacterium]